MTGDKEEQLRSLSDAATQGTWTHGTGPSLKGSYHTVETTETMVAEAYCALEMHNGTSVENEAQHAADAEFVVALVNAFRAGELVARSHVATPESGTPLLFNVHCMWQQEHAGQHFEWDMQWRELLAAIDQHLVRVNYPNAAPQADRGVTEKRSTNGTAAESAPLKDAVLISSSPGVHGAGTADGAGGESGLPHMPAVSAPSSIGTPTDPVAHVIDHEGADFGNMRVKFIESAIGIALPVGTPLYASAAPDKVKRLLEVMECDHLDEAIAQAEFDTSESLAAARFIKEAERLPENEWPSAHDRRLYLALEAHLLVKLASAVPSAIAAWTPTSQPPATDAIVVVRDKDGQLGFDCFENGKWSGLPDDWEGTVEWYPIPSAATDGRSAT